MIDNATLKMQFLFSLRKAGVVDKQVLEAMERVDRKNFVNGVFSEKSYVCYLLGTPGWNRAVGLQK